MRLNVDKVLVNLEGKDMTISEEDLTPLTLKSVLCTALITVVDPTEKRTGEQMLKCYDLGTRIMKGGEVLVSTDECTLIKAKVAESYTPLIYGQVHHIIEGSVKGPKEEEKK